MSEFVRALEAQSLSAERLRQLLEGAQRGDLEAQVGLRGALDANPELWQRYRDLAAHAETAWIERAGGLDPVLKQAMAGKVAELKAELAGPSPTPLERLLVERVAA